jgi:hypothetical protein
VLAGARWRWRGSFSEGPHGSPRVGLGAYTWLIENFDDGDEIFIFGFSRGAYTARALAGLIAIDGLLQQGSPIGVSELFDRYKRGDEETIWTLNQMQRDGDTAKMTPQERWLLKYARPVNIKVVGVWDTVGSIGIAAGDFTGISSSQFDYLQTGLRLPIQNGYHALAIDEHRAKFAPTIWDIHRSTASPRSLSSVEQRWFVGAHANVGGGYETDLLAQPPLRWLMKKAESQGLAFRSEVDLDGDGVTAKIKNSYGEFMYGAYQIISPRPFYRTIGAAPDARDDGTGTSAIWRRCRACFRTIRRRSSGRAPRAASSRLRAGACRRRQRRSWTPPRSAPRSCKRRVRPLISRNCSGWSRTAAPPTSAT